MKVNTKIATTALIVLILSLIGLFFISSYSSSNPYSDAEIDPNNSEFLDSYMANNQTNSSNKENEELENEELIDELDNELDKIELDEITDPDEFLDEETDEDLEETEETEEIEETEKDLEEETTTDNSSETEDLTNSESVEETSKYPITHTGTLFLEDGRKIEFELYGETAPVTVANFVKLAESGFYNGLIFHRVIENFMIQGGCPLGLGIDGSGESIVGEFSLNGFGNPISHDRGIISMARSSDYNSASSQFFIMHQDYPSLDGSYAAFGKVTSGLEVIDSIATVQKTYEPQTGSTDKPLEDIVIKTIAIN